MVGRSVQTLGSSGPKVKAAVKAAMGGCLFIDEAYALAEGDGPIGSGGDSFAKEAVRTMLTEFENNRTDLMVVMAGYAGKMDEMLRMDPGFPRRFPRKMYLTDYSSAEALAVGDFSGFAKKCGSYAITYELATPWIKGRSKATITRTVDVVDANECEYKGVSESGSESKK